MIPAAPALQPPRPAKPGRSRAFWLPSSVLRLLSPVLCLLVLSGCAVWRQREDRTGRTTFDSPLVAIPARIIGNQLFIEARWDRSGPYRFMVDTGASATLVSPEFARRYALDDPIPGGTPQVRVSSPDGRTTLLANTTIRRIELGDVTVEEVPALIYDFSALSAHYGVRIDGILGFPLFRYSILTLDYPQSRIVLTPPSADPLLPGTSLQFNNDNRTPIIPLRLGDTLFDALVDSGNDSFLSLNPVGLQPAFVVPPRTAGPVGTLTGTRTQRVGRLAGTVLLGSYELAQPLVDITDGLSSIGGATLRNFTVTFDQSRNRVTFHRDATTPIAFAGRRSAGLAFTKTPAYWRVAAVIPGSPAASAGIAEGELVTHIDGEPVSQWSLVRYEEHVRTAREIAFTFLRGRQETTRRVAVFDLVP